jgi:uncharacterized membrane protein
MIDAIRELAGSSALPNLHAAMLHFPVALLPVALLLDLACLVVRKKVWLDRSATLLYVLGTLAAAAAYLTGRSAAGDLWALPGHVQTTLADHEDLAMLTLLAYCITTVLRTIVTWLGREDWKIKIGFFRLLALIASTASLVLLLLTADRGGMLVYHYGVGSTPPASAQPPELR